MWSVSCASDVSYAGMIPQQIPQVREDRRRCGCFFDTLTPLTRVWGVFTAVGKLEIYEIYTQLVSLKFMKFIVS